MSGKLPPLPQNFLLTRYGETSSSDGTRANRTPAVLLSAPTPSRTGMIRPYACSALSSASSAAVGHQSRNLPRGSPNGTTSSRVALLVRSNMADAVGPPVDDRSVWVPDVAVPPAGVAV